MGYMTDVDLAPSPTEQLVDRIFGATLATPELLSVYLGWRLDLYRLLADNGPQRPAELAERSGIDGRYAREWLEQQATAGFLTVDDVGLGADDRRYALPTEHAEVLVDPESLAHVVPFAAMLRVPARRPQLTRVPNIHDTRERKPTCPTT